MSEGQTFKVVVEKHPDGYVAYPLGLRGIVVAEGDSYEEALQNVASAIRFHMETFGEEALTDEPPPAEVFEAEVSVSLEQSEHAEVAQGSP